MLPDVIETARLKLRPVTVDDVEAVLEYAGDPDWQRYVPTTPSLFTRRNAEKYVAFAVLCDPSTRPVWAITLDGQMVGDISLISEKNWRVATLGYGLLKRHWGRGLTSEAARAVVDQAFATYGQLRRIAAHTVPANDRSTGLLRKLGFTYEGTLRANQIENEQLIDEAVFSMLREEWITR